ncbi:hypothetical protein [Tranquillimonas rosea]|uniref:hypothetical protein n=1 Tax=Tranquillimonas rosea TaxID=641238 RepID=UPI003BAD558A
MAKRDLLAETGIEQGEEDKRLGLRTVGRSNERREVGDGLRKGRTQGEGAKVEAAFQQPFGHRNDRLEQLQRRKGQRRQAGQGLV